MLHIRRHDPRDNAGPNIPGVSKDDVTPQDELAAFDQLGPLTRKVINEVMCVRWSSHKTLEVITKLWRSDPSNPTVDRNMAEMLLGANSDIIAEIRVEKAIAPA
jgi:hypothetical protein